MMTPACPVTGHFSVGWDVDANLILEHLVNRSILLQHTVYCDKHVGKQNN